MNRAELSSTITSALTAYREQLQAQIEALDTELVSVNDALSLWQRNGNVPTPLLDTGTEKANETETEPVAIRRRAAPVQRTKPLRRAPYGQSPRIVQTWFANHPMSQLTISQLATAMNLSQQTVSKVLNTHQEVYEQTEGKKWRLKAGAKLSA